MKKAKILIATSATKSTILNIHYVKFAVRTYAENVGSRELSLDETAHHAIADVNIRTTRDVKKNPKKRKNE